MGQRQRKKKGRPISGWLVLNKPVDLGSTEAVSKIKWLFKAQKAGHAGTLDPLASGMLPIALGDATKTVPYVMDGRKIYQFTVTWGEQRSSDDLEGSVVETSTKRPTVEEIKAILPNYTGEISQKPPAFSAIKINGERAYDLAREGVEVEIPSRNVSIYRLDLVAIPDENTAQFEIECGKGTYVRALARDFGQDLGCFGHISKLNRSYVAPFDEDTMVPLSTLVEFEAIEDDDERFSALEAYLIDTGRALQSLPHINVNGEQVTRLRMGNAVLIRGKDAPADAPEAYATEFGRLIAVGALEKGMFKPKRVFGVN